MSLESIPKDLRNLRACLLCSMIKEHGYEPTTTNTEAILPVFTELHQRSLWLVSVFAPVEGSTDFTIKMHSEIFRTDFISIDQFEFDGCDNCEEHLGLKNNRDLIYDCTSSNFDGMIALMGGEDSWVAKWQRIGRNAKGVYAISIAGSLPPNIIQDLKSRGIAYRSRDTSTL